MENDAKLRQDVKEVVKILVSLLKDRVEVDDSPDCKKARINDYIQKSLQHKSGSI